MVTRTREQQQVEMAQTVDGIKKLTNAKLEAERSLRERRVMAGQCWSLSWAMQHRTAAASAEGRAHAGPLGQAHSVDAGAMQQQQHRELPFSAVCAPAAQYALCA